MHGRPCTTTSSSSAAPPATGWLARTLSGDSSAAASEAIPFSEALTNAVKYSSSVHLTAEAVGGVLRLSIEDDGVSGADPARGSGLIGLGDCVDVGGALTLVSQAGRGTRLLVELPLGPPRD